MTTFSVLESVLSILILLCAYKIFKFALFVYAFRNVPKMKESFPFSLPLDLLLQMRSSRNRVRQKNALTLPKSKVYPRWLYKALDAILPNYYNEPVLCCFYGPIAFMHAFTPESAEAVLSNTSNVHKGFTFHFLKPWLGNGLLSNPGDATWKMHRKMLTPAMHFRILDDYIHTMNENARKLVNRLYEENSNFVDVLPIMRMCTFSILFETAFGIKLDNDDPEHLDFLNNCDELADLILARFVNVAHWSDTIYGFTASGRRTQAATDSITVYIDKVIQMKLTDANNNDPDKRKSFIDIVLKMHRDGQLSRTDVRDHVATFIVGGFDTTATTLSFTLHLLGRHPDVLQKLQAEIDTVIGGSDDITKEQIKMMPYLDAVYKESLRLFPPLPLITRNLSKPVRVGKHLIPSGTIGIVHIYHLHRNPNVWKSPAEFVPSRFLETENRHLYSFVPFSAGPRNCIGQKFANQEDKILLTHMVRAFNIETQQKTEDIKLCMELILRPLDGLFVRHQPRF